MSEEQLKKLNARLSEAERLLEEANRFIRVMYSVRARKWYIDYQKYLEKKPV